MQKILIIIGVLILLMIFLNISIVLAEDLEITIRPKYYSRGREVIHTSDVTFSAISFEILGRNYNERSRILDLSIIEASPVEFKDSLPDKTESLRILQERVLWTSDLINLEDQTNITFKVSVSGMNEKTQERVYGEDSIDLKINKPQKNEPILLMIGGKIWESKPIFGLLVGIIIILSIIFLLWKYETIQIGWTDGKIDKWKQKERQKREKKYKMEEGY